jgi:hypothetical protein
MLVKCLQRSPAAACSCSQLGSTRMCWTTHAQGSQARLGPRLMPPQSQLLAYGPASPVNRSVELVLRSRSSPTRRAVTRSAPEPATRFDYASMACRAMLASGTPVQPPPISIRTITRHVGVKRAGMQHRPAVCILLCVQVWRLVHGRPLYKGNGGGTR